MIAPEATYPPGFQPLTSELINEWTTNYETRNPEKNVFSIKSNIVLPQDTIDNESEHVTVGHPGNVENHSYDRALEYWKSNVNMIDFFNIPSNILIQFMRKEYFDHYNGLWIVLKFSISNNRQFALIKARKNIDGPASTYHYAFFYDLREDLLIGVRALDGFIFDPDIDPHVNHDNNPDVYIGAVIDSFYNGLRHPYLFARQRGGKKNIKKKTKRTKKTNRKSKKRGKNSKKRRRTRKH